MKEIKSIGHARFVDELLSILRQHAFRDPLFDAIRSGRMSCEGAKTWALQAMLVVSQFTRFISAIHSNCPHRDAQRLLAENLWEEHGRGSLERDHLSLAKRLARSLGASDEEISRAEPFPETGNYIDHCLKATREGSFIEGMTAIGVGIEYYIPKFFGALADGLRSHYGLTREDVEFLSVHVGEDEDHARRAMEMIETYADTDEIKEKARQALLGVIEAKRRFAESLYQRLEVSSQ
ncbi:MAG: iron-containing redox enzyme family protein [Acidobacteriota bacterium]